MLPKWMDMQKVLNKLNLSVLIKDDQLIKKDKKIGDKVSNGIINLRIKKKILWR